MFRAQTGAQVAPLQSLIPRLDETNLRNEKLKIKKKPFRMILN